MEENKNLNVETPNLEEATSKYSALTSANNSLAAALKKDAATYDVKKVERNAKIQKTIVTVIIYAFLFFLAIVVIFPFYWMIISSLKTYDEYILSTPTFWPTQTVYWKNYVDAYSAANLGLLFLNTVYVGLVSTLLSLVITVLSAFAFARLEFKGRDSMFAFMLATMMIPGELFTITNYQTVIVFLDWKNTFTALIVPFLVSVFYIYLLRQNFKQIPNELYLAAKVDGKTDMEYLLKVMIPLALPSLISITILKMMGAWNSYIWPRLVTDDTTHKLITNGLRGASFFVDGDENKINYPAQMAAVVIVSAPLFLVFIFLRKYIMKGVSRSGIKG
ncbi:MAG: carbohydrate ABC transporter permease [Erysipelotrichaceae bacterium]|nr:carbohydrate ABC transporter permease [Erysipelotrichaceae bacterium]